MPAELKSTVILLVGYWVLCNFQKKFAFSGKEPDNENRTFWYGTKHLRVKQDLRGHDAKIPKRENNSSFYEEKHKYLVVHTSTSSKHDSDTKATDNLSFINQSLQFVNRFIRSYSMVKAALCQEKLCLFTL